nr:hypothetical protein BaRGS_022565 [Batillaria attramentaria]
MVHGASALPEPTLQVRQESFRLKNPNKTSIDQPLHGLTKTAEWSMTVEIPKQKKGAGELFYKGVEISQGDTFGRRQINAAHRDRLM